MRNNSRLKKVKGLGDSTSANTPLNKSAEENAAAIKKNWVAVLI